VQAGFVGRGQGVAVGAQALARASNWRLCSSMLRCSAASTWICCCTCTTAVRCSSALAWAWRRASSRSGRRMACSSTWAASSSAFSSASTPGPARCSSSAVGLFAARCPTGRSAPCQLHQALLHALAAFDHVADFGLQPADFGAGLVQLALGLVDLVAGGVVRLADGFQLGLDMAQVGHARFQVVDGLQALLERTLACSASASARLRNHSWCCLSVAGLQAL
jgi:hypothetical protein